MNIKQLYNHMDRFENFLLNAYEIVPEIVYEVIFSNLTILKPLEFEGWNHRSIEQYVYEARLVGPEYFKLMYKNDNKRENALRRILKDAENMKEFLKMYAFKISYPRSNDDNEEKMEEDEKIKSLILEKIYNKSYGRVPHVFKIKEHIYNNKYMNVYNIKKIKNVRSGNLTLKELMNRLNRHEKIAQNFRKGNIDIGEAYERQAEIGWNSTSNKKNWT